MKDLINWKKSGVGGVLGGIAFVVIYYLFSFTLSRRLEKLGYDAVQTAIKYPPTIQELLMVFLIGIVIGATIVYLVDVFIHDKKKKRLK